MAAMDSANVGWFLLGLGDCRVAKLTADIPATLTYDTLIDIPGIMEFKVDLNLKTSENEGDGRLTAAETVCIGGDFSFSCDRFPSKAVQMMMGASVADTGTTPSNIQHVVFDPTHSYPYFKIEGQSLRAQGTITDVHFVAWKCKLSKLSVDGLKGASGFVHVSGSGKILKPNFTATASVPGMLSFIGNETTTAIV